MWCSNLVLILDNSTRCGGSLALLGWVGEHVESYANAKGLVLGIAPDSPETLRDLTSEVRPPCRLLSDSSGRSQRVRDAASRG